MSTLKRQVADYWRIYWLTRKVIHSSFLWSNSSSSNICELARFFFSLGQPYFILHRKTQACTASHRTMPCHTTPHYTQVSLRLLTIKANETKKDKLSFHVGEGLLVIVLFCFVLYGLFEFYQKCSVTCLLTVAGWMIWQHQCVPKWRCTNDATASLMKWIQNWMP